MREIDEASAMMLGLIALSPSNYRDPSWKADVRGDDAQEIAAIILGLHPQGSEPEPEIRKAADEIIGWARERRTSARD